MLYVVFPPRFNIFPFRFHLRNQVISSCGRDGPTVRESNSDLPECMRVSHDGRSGNSGDSKDTQVPRKRLDCVAGVVSHILPIFVTTRTPFLITVTSEVT